MPKSYLKQYLNKVFNHEKYGPVGVIKYNTEYHLRCLEKGCSYHERPQSYNVNHKHTITSVDITQFCVSDKEYYSHLKLLTAQFSAEANLSSNFISKPVFKNFVCSVASYAFDFAKKYPNVSTFPSLSFNASENTKLIEFLNQTRNEQVLLKFKNNYVSLIFDAGTVCHLHTLEFLIASYDIEPYLYESISFSEFSDCVNYKQEILKVTRKLIQDKITPIAFIADNLPAQKKAINHISLDSIQMDCIHNKNTEDFSQNEKIIIGSIVNVSCLNHILNLALNEILETISFLKTARDMVLEFQTFSKEKEIRKYVKEDLGSKFHINICFHRWVYLNDAIKYLLRKESVITSIYSDNKFKGILSQYSILKDLTHQQFFHSLKLALDFLEPIKILSLKLESSNAILSKVKPWFAEFSVEIKKRGQFHSKQNDATKILQIIHNRIMTTGQPELIISSFFLSFLGKYYLNYYETHEPNLYEKDHCTTDDSDRIVKCIDQLPKDCPIQYERLVFPDLNLNQHQENEESEIIDLSDEDLEKFEYEQSEDEELINTKEQLKTLIKLLKSSISQIELINQLDSQLITNKINDFNFWLYQKIFQSFSNNFNKLYQSYCSIFNSKYFFSYHSESDSDSESEFKLDILELTFDETNKKISNLSEYILSVSGVVLGINEMMDYLKEFFPSIASQYTAKDYKENDQDSRLIHKLIFDLSTSLKSFESSIFQIIKLTNEMPWNKVEMIIQEASPKVLTEYCVSEMSKLLNITPNEALRQLDIWWKKNLSDDAYSHFYYCPKKYWSSMDNNCCLKHIIPRFLFLSVSEASAERIFSCKRNIINDNFSNVSNKYIKDRLQIQNASKILQFSKTILNNNNNNKD